MRLSRVVSVALFVAALSGCKQKEPSQQASPAQTSSAPQPATNDSVKLFAPFGRRTDDLDQIVKRRNLRAIVVLNPTGFFYVNGHPMGITFEALRELETYINKREKTKAHEDQGHVYS